jgi:hypothetical protein
MKNDDFLDYLYQYSVKITNQRMNYEILFQWQDHLSLIISKVSF